MSQEEISSLKIIAKGAGIFFFGMFIAKILFFIFRVFIARYFGPEDYGLFSIGLTIVSFAMVFAALGLPAGVTRYISYHRTRKNEAGVKGTITSSLQMTLLASLVIFFVIFFFSEELANNVFHEPMLTGVIQVMAIAIPFNAMFSMLTASFEGFQKIKYRIYTDHMFLHGAKLAFVVAFGLLGYGVFGIALSHTIAMILTFFLAFYFFNSRVYPFFKSDIKPTRMKRELLSFSLPLMLAVFMGSIMMWIDTLMLGYFRGAADVGVYNVAHPTAWLLCFIVAAFSALFLPVITELYTKHKKRELEIVSKIVTKWIFYFNLPFLLLMVFFSRQILNMVFGPEYIVGYAALGILSLGFFVTSINMTSYHILNVLKKTKSIFYITAACAAINVVLNIALIPVWGITGAAVASAVTYIIMTVLLITIAWQITHILPFSKIQMFKSAVIGIISIVLIYVIGRVLFSTFTIYIFLLLGLAFLVLYALLLLVFGCVEKEDIEILRAVEKKSGMRSERLRNFVKKFVK